MPSTLIESISDFLSVITIATCLVCKVPQIMKLRSLKSAEGMNMKALMLELFSYSVMLLYNYTNRYSLISYMEYPIILVQEWVLIFYVLKYKNFVQNPFVQLLSGAYFAFFFGFLVRMFPASVLTFTVPFCTPISASSKVLFLYEILSTGNARAVSLLTWAISAFTNATRIFTVFVDSTDINLLANFTVSTFLSSSIMVSAWYYKKNEKQLIQVEADKRDNKTE